MPQLVNRTLTRYENYVGERLEAFKDPLKGYLLREYPEDCKIEPFFHKPRYDAESVFWLLLYWAIQAGYPKVPIQRERWTDLTGGDKENDTRVTFISTQLPSVLHPAYKELEGLFARMAKQLHGEPFFDSYDGKKEGEYLDEVL